MLKFYCPTCNQKLSAEDNAIGKTVKCPTCNTNIEIPIDWISNTKTPVLHDSLKQKLKIPSNISKKIKKIVLHCICISVICFGIGIPLSIWYINNIHAKKIYKSALIDFEKGNYQNAIKNFEYAASKKITDAKYKLGYCYFYGLGIKHDIQKTIFYLQEFAQSGNIEAQYILGLCHINNNNIDDAKIYFQRAAAQKHPESQFVLGLIYFEKEKNFTEAAYWFQKASEQGCEKSLFFLNKFFKFGFAIMQNSSKAKALNNYNLALDSKSIDNKIINSILKNIENNFPTSQNKIQITQKITHKKNNQNTFEAKKINEIKIPSLSNKTIKLLLANNNLYNNTLADAYNQKMQAIGVVVAIIESRDKITEEAIGTAFAISKNRFVTNSHVAYACRFNDLIFEPLLQQSITYFEKDRGRRPYPYEKEQIKILVKNNLKNNNYKIKHIEIRLNHSKGKRFIVNKIQPHPKYTPKGNGEFDVAIMEIIGYTDCYFDIASKEDLYNLKVGTQIASAGFPMEGLSDLNLNAPEASYAIGTIKKMTNFKNEADSPENNRSIFHTIPAAGGASGSPIFTADGKIIAVLWGGAVTGISATARIGSSAMQNYAVRIDQIESIGEINTTCKDWIKSSF